MKLEPQKDSRRLEKTLLKHRQINSKTVLKKSKEFNALVKSHTTEFYKFHCSVRLSRSSFCKSIRDNVNLKNVKKKRMRSWKKRHSVFKDGTKTSKRGMNSVVMRLRKVCKRPYMFTSEEYYITEDIIRTSGKVELLDRMLPRLKAAGYRVLLFFKWLLSWLYQRITLNTETTWYCDRMVLQLEKNVAPLLPLKLISRARS